ncbi:hypothetical protein PR048_027741 [Dryococelus australis]|uniref:Transposable element P transposase n=1 Tax=Dryococelus australis TaxID=614101 RepID=A0ABQ9GHC3_9NEOP|nr:hypothetical protein PR048_027741 [Dryococelus australis]
MGLPHPRATSRHKSLRQQYLPAVSARGRGLDQLADPPIFLHGAYHRFPNDLVTGKNWIFACRRKVFKADTSKRDLESELAGIKRNRTLETNEVPHLLLPNGIWRENDEIAAAVALRSISRKAYLYLRKNVGLPLPGLSTIRKWTRNLKCLPGIQKELLSVLKDKLFEVIKEGEDSGFEVVTIVSDIGGGNLISFTISADVTRKLWVFADIPHIIKLLRNNFLDYGIRLPCGTEISKLQQILSDKELLLTLKLDTRVHLNVSGSAQQKKATIVSIKSLTGLYNDLVSTKNLKYVITCRLNQDVLETPFFSGT